MVLICAMLFGGISSGCTKDEQLTIEKDWKIFVGDDPVFKDPSFDDSKWPSIDLPSLLSKETDRDVLWLRKSFGIPSRLESLDLMFFAGKIWDVEKTFFNGVNIGRSGREYPNFFSTWNFDRSYRLPPRLIRPDGENVIAIRIFANQKSIYNGKPFVGSSSDVSIVQFWQELKAQYIPLSMGVLTLFMGVFSVILFALNPRLKLALHFAGISFAWTLLTMHFYLREFGISYNTKETIYYAMLGIEIAWFYVFLEKLFGVEYKYLKGFVIMLALLVSVLSLTSTYESPVTGWRSQVIGGIGIVTQVLWGVLLVKSIEKTEVKLIFVSYLIFMVCLVHDVLAISFLITYDFFWINLGYPAMIAAFGMVLSLRSVAMSKQLYDTTVHLEQALEEAKQSMRVKNEFLSNTSHELRTPLNSIINIPEGIIDGFEYADVVVCESCNTLYRMEENSEPGEEDICPACGAGSSMTVTKLWHYRAGDMGEIIPYLRSVASSGRQLLKIVEDILSFSTLEAGKGLVETERISVTRVVTQVCLSTRELAVTNRVTLSVSEVDPNLTVTADSVKLPQILTYLVENAIKFSGRGGSVEVHVSANNGAVPFSGVTFEVKDNGIGISEENQKIIFDSFRQVDGGHTRGYGGTGLGLSITKELVEMHGGQIWVKSEVGKGSSFFVAIPS